MTEDTLVGEEAKKYPYSAVKGIPTGVLIEELHLRFIQVTKEDKNANKD